MNCPKCNHPLSDERVTCVYCGEPISGPAPVSEAPEVSEELSIEDMVRHTMEGIKDKPETVRKLDSETGALSIEKTAAMLGKMKSLMDNGRFDADVYERMALDSIKDYLSTMSDDARLIFVSYEIADSKLAPFLTAEMIEKIKLDVMDAIAER